VLLQGREPVWGRLRRTVSGAVDWLIGTADFAASALTRRAPIDGTAGGRQIVVLPGILENPRYLTPLITYLRARGHRVVLVYSLGFNLHSLEASVERVLAELTHGGVRDAVIVAHSKGGLIGKALLLDPRSEGVLVGMVAVATPFSGSLLWPRAQRSAAVSGSPLGLFHPENPELTRLRSEGAVNARIVSLAPGYDQVVPGGSHLEGAVNEALPVEGHFRAVRDPACLAIIADRVASLDAPDAQE